MAVEKMNFPNGPMKHGGFPYFSVTFTRGYGGCIPTRDPYETSGFNDAAVDHWLNGLVYCNLTTTRHGWSKMVGDDFCSIFWTISVFHDFMLPHVWDVSCIIMCILISKECICILMCICTVLHSQELRLSECHRDIMKTIDQFDLIQGNLCSPRF